MSALETLRAAAKTIELIEVEDDAGDTFHGTLVDLREDLDRVTLEDAAAELHYLTLSRIVVVDIID